MQQLAQPVVSGVRFFLAHAPGLVRYGSKPIRDIDRDVSVLDTIRSHLRSYEQAAAYPPNRAFLGHLHPDELASLSKPWFDTNGQVERWGPYGEIMPEESFYGLLKICDAFDLVQLEAGFVEEIHPELEAHPLLTADDLAALGPGLSATELSELLDQSPHALSLELRSGRRIGLMHAAHDVDTSLAADVLLENLCCKATAVMAMRTLITQQQIDPDAIPYILNSGEEAVGDRYQRGGGNLAKAVAEMSHCQLATGVEHQGLLLWSGTCTHVGRKFGQLASLRSSRGDWGLFPGQIGHEISRACAA